MEENVLPNQQELLFNIVGKGDLNKVKDLVESGGVNINEKNKDGWTPLHIAAEKSHMYIVKYLVVNGAKVNVKNENGVIPLVRKM